MLQVVIVLLAILVVPAVGIVLNSIFKFDSKEVHDHPFNYKL